jgi:hypothetical protein
MWLFVEYEVIDSCLMLILGTEGVGAGGLVVREAARDNDTALLDYLEHVSCAKVSTLVIIIVCVYVYPLFY